VDIRTALLQGAQLLEDARISAPRLTAEVLLAHAAAKPREWLYAHSSDELSELWWIHYGRYLHERLNGKPTQYITGRQEFYGRDFRVTPDVLIPRPETEHVIEAALQCSPRGLVLDIGTGSGAIAVTLALESAAHVFATDISAAALRVASENAGKLNAQVGFVACDLGASFRDSSFEMIVSNPPYVPAKDRASTQREVRDYEPAIAVWGGEDGLDFYRRLIPEARRLLQPGGCLIMELAYSAQEAVEAMLSGWIDIERRHDLAGLPRVIRARKSP